jgi:hypothetical protein
MIRTGIFSIAPSIPFGHVSIMLIGNLHQFPPVASANKELYNSTPTDELSHLGHTLFEQFDTVIHLDRQMHICDPVWEAILTRSRTGECTANDLTEIDRLVLDDKDCEIPDFTVPPWNDCVLVTPRNAVQTLWNELMLQAHCHQTGYTQYVVHTLDTVEHGHLTQSQRVAIAHLKLEHTNHLPNKIELAVGMKLMILTNIAVGAGLANGSRGIVTDIILDPRETFEPLPSTTWRLSYPPAIILFSPLHGSPIHIPGLPLGTIPIFLSTKTFKLGTKPGVTVKRSQFPVTPTYAFTDYKAQGQTMESVIVDLGKPPTGSISGFNGYIALSRGHGRKTIRLLRPFDHKLFTVHPNEQLRHEDIRLSKLEEHTLQRYHAGEFSIA